MSRQRKPAELTLIEELLTDEQLRHYQKHPVDFIYDVIFHEHSKYHKSDGYFVSRQQEDILNALAEDGSPSVSVVSGKGAGKAHSLYTKIPMFDGGFKCAGDIAVGDKVIGSNGEQVTILMVHPHKDKNIYRMKFSGGVESKVCGDHLWNVWKRSKRPMKTMSTLEIKKHLEVVDKRRGDNINTPTVGRPFIQMPEPVKYKKRELILHPWVLGVLIGDGSLSKKSNISHMFSNVEPDILQCLSIFADNMVQYKDTCDYRVYGFNNQIEELGLKGKRSWEKAIPENYLYSDVNDRLELLRGLCDTDGHVCSGNSIEYCTTSEKLAEQVQQLVRSLGGSAVIYDKETPTYSYKGEKRTGRHAYRVYITFSNGLIPVSSEKHLKKWTGKCQRKNMYIESIEFDGVEDAVCFTVDSHDSLYLCDDYVVTHNTALGSFSSLWFLTCFPEPKIAITAPTAPQLNAAFWPEVNLWLGRSLVKDVFTHTSERLYYNARPKNWWAEPRTARKPESMQGLHADHQLIIIDEGSGVEDPIFRAIDDTQTGIHNVTLAISNGTRTNGWFFDSQHSDKLDWSATFQFNAMDSPFVNKKKAQKLIDKYGWEHDIVRVGIRGMFPKGNVDSFIQYEDVQAAMYREYEPKKTDKVSIGLDVARMGDDQTVLTWRWGNKFYPQEARSKSRLNDTMDWLIVRIKEIRKQTGVTTTIRIKIDDTGMNGIVDFLRPYSNELNIEVVSCIFSSGNGDDVYADIISIMWGKAKDALEHCALPESDTLREELSSRRVSFNGGKIRIEPKESYKRDFGDSPDYADSFILCCYEPKTENKVITHFDRYDTCYVKGHIDYIGNADIIASIVYSKEHTASVAKAVWDGYKFYVIDTFYKKSDVADVISFMKRTPCDEIIGNELMFGTRGNDIRSQFGRYGMFINKNRGYDINGGIQLINMLSKEKRFVVHAQCVDLLSQLDEWDMEGSQSSQLSTFGLCYAVVAVASKLRPMIIPETVVYTRPSDYGKTEKVGIDYTGLNPWEFM